MLITLLYIGIIASMVAIVAAIGWFGVLACLLIFLYWGILCWQAEINPFHHRPFKKR